MKYDYAKVFIGDTSVGKTTLVNTICNKSNLKTTEPTIEHVVK